MARSDSAAAAAKLDLTVTDDLAPCDVAIVGGGPAGAATARHLAVAGFRVRLCEAAAMPAPKVGEGLPPSARPLLVELGLKEQLDEHRPSRGSRSLWGSDEIEEKDFLFSPWGAGWHLDRALFERQLLELAAAAGVDVRLGSPCVGIAGEAGAWQVTTLGGTRFDARYVVDATGRAASLAQRLGGRREHSDHLLAFACTFARAADDPDANITLEATAHGWWYSAMIPGLAPSRRMVVYLTDPRSPTRREVAHAAGFERLLKKTHLVGPVCFGAGFAPLGPPSGHPAGSSRLVPCGGPGWLAVGDAAMAYDPLSSQGLKSALEGARQAAMGIELELGSRRECAATAYREFCESHWLFYRDRRRQYYQLEQRWPAEPFWARRHQTFRAPQGGTSWRLPQSASIQPSE